MFSFSFLLYHLQTAIVLAILWQELGPSCLAGIMLLILFVPLQSELEEFVLRLYFIYLWCALMFGLTFLMIYLSRLKMQKSRLRVYHGIPFRVLYQHVSSQHQNNCCHEGMLWMHYKCQVCSVWNHFFLWIQKYKGLKMHRIIAWLMLWCFFLIGWMGKVFSKLRLATAHRTDERVRIMNEIINAMRVIKMYTWEKPFTALAEQARK